MERPRLRKFNVISVLLIFWLALMVREAFRLQPRMERIPYSRFLSLVQEKKIQSVRILEDRIEGGFLVPPLIETRSFVTTRLEDPGLVQFLSAAGVRFEAERGSSLFRDLLSWFAPLVLLGFFCGLSWAGLDVDKPS